MDERIKKRLADPEVYLEMVKGAVIALSYTDEEIRETLCEEEAQEFIDLRNKVFARLKLEEQKYITDTDANIPMAAEDEAPYKN